MKERIIRYLKHGIILGLGSTLVGVLLLFLIFCLPVGRAKEHVFQDVDTVLIAQEQVPEAGLWNYIHSNRETFTDSIMVQNAIEDIEGKNAYEHAIWAYHWDLGNDVVWNPEETLRTLSGGSDTSQMYLRTYARYWHGYLIYLKPLLMMFGWEQVMVLGAVFLLGLLVALALVSVRTQRAGVFTATLVGMLFLKPLLIHASLTMSVCWAITLGALLFMTWKHEWLEKKEFYAEFFLIIGILTAYFDFLTYPIVTVGFPLCAYFLMKKGITLKTMLGNLVGFCISWGLGYAGMWAMKWIVSDLTLQTGTIRDAVWAVIGRTEAVGSRTFGAFYVIGLNLQEYNLPVYTVLAVLIALVSLVLVVLAVWKSGIRKMLPMLLVFLVISCIPFAWIVVVQHHSALHARFTFRIIAVAAMAIGSMGIYAAQELRNIAKNK